MARALRVVRACALALFSLGLAILPLQTADFTHAVSSRVSEADEAGLTSERMVQVAETVRRFVVEGEGELPREVDGVTGFDRSAVDHLVDVRALLRAARLLTLALGLILGAWFAATWMRGRIPVLSSTLRSGAALTLALPTAGLLAGVLSFDALFRVFHSLFFDSGTWVFPSDSLLIRIFPEAFWVTCGITWAALVVVLAGCLAALAMVLERGPMRARA